MSRSGGSCSVAGCLARACLVLVPVFLVLCPAPAAAISEGSLGMGGIKLDKAASRSLLRLQEGWIQWISAYYQERQDEAEQEIAELESSLQLLGMERLPELAKGAVVRGVEAAFRGQTERAEYAFATAERLDPGRPEVEFGRALLARESGSTVSALVHLARGYARPATLPELRKLWWRNLWQVALSALALAGAGFVLLLFVHHGAELFGALGSALSRYLPAGLNHVVALLFLAWPLALPGGVAWLILYWSILVWGSAEWSQRIVLVFVWVMAGVAPIIVVSQERALELDLSPPVRALDALAEGRLYGGLFTDLDVLRSLLPEEPAVQQVVADVHRKIGQWERARDLYLWILEQEPDNVEALLAVGTHYFRKGDYGNATRYYQHASSIGEGSAAAFYNLSQAYSDTYLFDDQRRAFARARELGDLEVSSWIRAAPVDRVVVPDGGIARRDEIRALLEQRVTADEALGGSPYLPLALSALALGLAIAFQRVRPGAADVRDTSILTARGPISRLFRVLVPGLTSSEDGQGVRPYLLLLVMATLLLLLDVGRIGYEVPLGLYPGGALAAAVAGSGLTLFYAARILRHVRG